MEIKKYNLPDLKIMTSNREKDFIVWIPDSNYIVLGQSNKFQNSIIEENVLRDEIPVFQRPSGGETVILTPDTIIVSIKENTAKLENPKKYFKRYNNIIINSLENFQIQNLYEKGISDIALNDKKILGSSIYRNFKYIFYHAVINLGTNPLIIDKYLKHPEREPSYRNKRKHSDFVTSLTKEGFLINIEELAENLRITLRKELKIS